MDTNQIIQRLEDLHAVLQYCAENETLGKSPSFSRGERICINQERGSLMSQLNAEHFPNDVRNYKCLALLESKIRFTLKKIIDNHLT
ncbi:hypothetical protein [Flavobacterium praedii]|uniref:hypothetical protein n=1 Tax=Flavobacterium praedii TaxID=3002900 RepID=UPI002481B97B|nr:hypothetical protein [Flavobacterium praedii]